MKAAAQAGTPSSVVVSTSCPTCGAPLEVGETANATRCGHCRSHLAVTGRGHTLTYQIAPRVPPAEARSLVRFSLPSNGTHWRVDDPRMILFPYYRITGLDLRWTRPPEPEQSEPEIRQTQGDVIAFAAALAARPRPIDPPVFAGRWVERNVTACDTAGLASYSLGIRPSVLRLELFRPDEGTMVVAPTRSVERMLGPDDEPTSRSPITLYKTMIAQHLAMIYFPYWILDVHSAGGHRCVIVDGTAATIVARDVDPDAVERLTAPTAPPARTLGFRPLACPNCGWDLPTDPAQVVFHCGSCARAWELAADGLDPIPYRAVQPPTGEQAEYERLPVWVVERAAPATPGRVFAPAFHFRQLRRAIELGQHLTNVDPELPPDDTNGHLLGRCHIDRSDARTLARFILAGLHPGGTPPPEEASDDGTRPHLTWLPFRVGPYALHEPRTGTPLPKRLLG